MKTQTVTVTADYRRERGEHTVRYAQTEQIGIEKDDVPADVVAEARRRLMADVHGAVERALDHLSPPL